MKMKFLAVLFVSSHVVEIKSASMVYNPFPGGISQMHIMQAQTINPDSQMASEDSRNHQDITGFTPEVCKLWRIQSQSATATNKPRETEALRVLTALDDGNCGLKPSGKVNCNLLTFIKGICGGNFAERSSPKTLRGLSPLGVIGMKDHGDRRVSATVVFTSLPSGSMTNIVEQYMDSYTKNRGGSARMRNSITVDSGKQEMSISAGTAVNDVYSFSHSNSVSRSLYVILYMGGTMSVNDGIKIMKDFQTYLGSKNYQVSTFALSTSAQENADEKIVEERIEDTISQNSQVASFALDVLCLAGGN